MISGDQTQAQFPITLSPIFHQLLSGMFCKRTPAEADNRPHKFLFPTWRQRTRYDRQFWMTVVKKGKKSNRKGRIISSSPPPDDTRAPPNCFLMTIVTRSFLFPFSPVFLLSNAWIIFHLPDSTSSRQADQAAVPRIRLDPGESRIDNHRTSLLVPPAIKQF